ncbi:MAG: hypothetical protein JWR20_2092 [Marmoricola sp.]|nr:hypothetical protein [Marmoricola sp.]
MTLVSAPTLWEEGQMAGSRVVGLAVVLGLVSLGPDLLLGDRLGLVFDAGLVLVCVGAALAVRPRDSLTVALLPPALLLGLVVLLSVLDPGRVARAGDGVVQAVVSGLAHHATALLLAYLLTVGVLVVRHRVRVARRAQANLPGSPAPTRVTSGTPSEKSTTVVGSAPHSPESSTASTK